MIRQSLQSVLCICLSPLVVAQQTLPTAATPAGRDKPAILEKGTEVKLVLLETVSSATAKNGQKVRMAVAEDVSSNGVIVIRKGTPATGEVAELRKPVLNKRNGYFSIKPVDLTMASGSRLKLREYPPDACEPDGPCWLLRILVLPFMPFAIAHETEERHRHPETGKEYTKQISSSEWGYLAEKLAAQPASPLSAQ